MSIAIVASAQDSAGMGIKAALQEQGFAPAGGLFHGTPVLQRGSALLYTVRDDAVLFDGCDALPGDLIIFATRHQSRKGTPALCAHAIGNWGPAEMGGMPERLGIAPAWHVKRAVQLLVEKNGLGWDVFQEATHHGPMSNRPVLFIEIGSTEREYWNQQAAEIVAETILDLISSDPHRCLAAVGIGGLHHAPNFRKVQMQSDIAIGHICPKYNLPSLTRAMLHQAIERTVPRAELLVLDWKGLGAEKKRIVELAAHVAKEAGCKVLRTQDF